MGMRKVLQGIMTYRNTLRTNLVEQFERIRDNPNPTALLFTCMDSRMLPSRFTQAQVGEIFMVRNSGNMVPHATNYGIHGSEVSVTTEPAALELACVRGGIRDAIVCGHSDCKAMNTLYNLHTNPASFIQNSPLDLWLRRHAFWSLGKLEQRLKSTEPIEFIENIPEARFLAHIDPEDRFNVTDKLSQINTLQQLENICSHEILYDLLRSNTLRLHAMWFDVYTGDVYYFSRRNERFIVVDDGTVGDLETEVAN